MSHFFNYPFASLLRLRYLVMTILITALMYFYLDIVVAKFFAVYQQQLQYLCKFIAMFFNGKMVLPIVLFMIGLSYFLDCLKPWRHWLCALLFCLFMGQLMLIVLKPIIGRARPYLVLEAGEHIFKHLQFSDHYYSFPSGHTINIMIISGMLSLRYPKKSMLILCCGLFLSFIRVVNVVHFLSDWFFTAYLSLVFIPISRALIGLFSEFKWTRQIELGFEEIQ